MQCKEYSVTNSMLQIQYDKYIVTNAMWHINFGDMYFDECNFDTCTGINIMWKIQCDNFDVTKTICYRKSDQCNGIKTVWYMQCNIVGIVTSSPL